MAKSMAEIQMDYKKAMAQAAQLDNIAKKFDSMAKNQFGGCMSKVASNWKGENANIYLQKGNVLQNKMVASAKELKSIAASIRVAAEKVRKAEIKAYNIAKSLK